MKVHTGVGGSGDRRTYNIHYAQHNCAALPRLLNRGKGIGGLAGLTYRYHQCAIFNYRVPVAKLTCILRLSRYSRQLLEKKLTDQPRMKRGAAGSRYEALGTG